MRYTIRRTDKHAVTKIAHCSCGTSMPAVILQFIDRREGFNQYVPFADKNDALADIKTYLNNGGDVEDLGVYVDQSHGEEYVREIQTLTRKLSGQSVRVLGIRYGVYCLAV
jgi:hypothetical protein